ncbi:MAG: hypothetical protein U1E10_00285, partial [Bdellovibrionales bacterium]|nr:hypothetical protein [Bdellovibrionales bacterium]
KTALERLNVFPDKSGLRLHFSKKIDSLRLYRFPASAIMEPGLICFSATTQSHWHHSKSAIASESRRIRGF